MLSKLHNNNSYRNDIWRSSHLKTMRGFIFKKIDKDDFKVDGNRYHKIRSVFSQGIGEYVHAGISAPKFIGGMNFRRNHNK